MVTEPKFHPVALRAARERAGLTQHQLAHRLGVAGGERVSRWELGLSTPRAESLAELAHVLGIQVDDLLQPPPILPTLRVLRLRYGFGGRDLARRAHMPFATYMRWESGSIRHTPSDTSLAPLALALGAEVALVRTAVDNSRHAAEERSV
ncbi:helix-turn-helix domain-containing protein [Segeticoccus rhizosphaerae]|uniref:helix-turn-helix domain-containing protein n=1 Tax=Segeticoccus rhizosphaerae TaxID=1104777 RepID=UPI0010C14732